MRSMEETVNHSRTTLVAPTPVMATPTSLLTASTSTLVDCYPDPFHPVIQPYTYAPAPLYHPATYEQPTYHQPDHPYTSYSPFDADSKHLGSKFLPRTSHHLFKRELAREIPRERKRPGPKAKMKSEEECKVAEEPEYDPEVIANAHLTMEDDHYKCSVCKMKFKQPGNARRHIITVHRNEKPHDCEKCGAKFGRKDKLKTHMMRNHGYSNDDIKNTFKQTTPGRQRKRSRIVVHRDNRKSTESNSNSSDDPEANPLNLKPGRKHLNTQNKRRKP